MLILLKEVLNQILAEFTRSEHYFEVFERLDLLWFDKIDLAKHVVFRFSDAFHVHISSISILRPNLVFSW